ncbi:unnamed protein product [Withania somnifera]
MLREAGAMKSRESQTTSQESAVRVDEKRGSRSPAKKLFDYFKYDTIKDSPCSVRNTLLGLCFSPPGGVWQDHDSSTGNNNGTPHVAGESIMGYHNPKSYRIFLICNSVGFFTSLHMMNFLTIGFPMILELQVSVTALVFTNNDFMPFVAPITTVGMRNFLKAPKLEIPSFISRIV